MRACSAHDRRRARSGRSTPNLRPEGTRRARSCARSPATSPTTSAGRRPGSSRRCSRRGRSRATSTSARRTSTRVAPLVWRPRDRRRTSSTTSRRCGGGSRSTSRVATADRQLKLGPGGLRDVEFAVQLLQLVHGRSDDAAAQPATLPRSRRSPRGGYVGREDAATSPTPTGSCGRSSTASSCTGCAARTSCPRTRPTCGGIARVDGHAQPTRSAELMTSGGGTRARCAGCTRSCSTGRCSDAVARLDAGDGPADPGRGGAAARRRSATPTPPARCGTSRR